METEPRAARAGAMGPGEPPGVALTGHVHPVDPEGRSPPMVRVQSDGLLPEVPTERPPCHREPLTATTEVPQEMSASAEMPQELLSATDKLPTEALPAAPSMMPPDEDGKDPCEDELLPCPGKWETCPSKMPRIVVPVMPTSLQTPAEQPRRLVPRGSCLIHNWQEERATNHLDAVPGQEPGSEGFTYRHGHHGLLVHDLQSWTTASSTTKDTYRTPRRVLLLGRGQREAMLESMLYQKYRKEMLEETRPPRMPVQLVSTTHQDYCAGGCQFTPQPTTQPHNYSTEQPCSFWLEQARSLPGVTSIASGNSPFRRNAAFSTPITEYLGQPLPCAPLSSWPQSHKQ